MMKASKLANLILQTYKTKLKTSSFHNIFKNKTTRSRTLPLYLAVNINQNVLLQDVNLVTSTALNNKFLSKHFIEQTEQYKAGTILCGKRSSDPT